MTQTLMQRLTKFELFVKSGRRVHQEVHLGSGFLAVHVVPVVLHTTEVKHDAACNQTT